MMKFGKNIFSEIAREINHSPAKLMEWLIIDGGSYEPVSVTHFSSGVNDKWPLKGP